MNVIPHSAGFWTVITLWLGCYSFFWSLMPIIGNKLCSRGNRNKLGHQLEVSRSNAYRIFLLPNAGMLCTTCGYNGLQLLQNIQDVMSTLSADNLNNTNVHAIREALEKERKMTWVTVALASGFLLAWTPYVISTIVAILKPNVMTELAASIPAYIAKSSFCYKPIIYASVDKKMRRKP